jgi:hypothetical protein
MQNENVLSRPASPVHGQIRRSIPLTNGSASKRSIRLLRGGMAGILATVPMTVLMVLWHRRLPFQQRDPLPPAQVTESLLASVDLHDDLAPSQKLPLIFTNRFAYGAAMGSLYGLLAGPRSRQHPISSGILYGLTVWAANYGGLLPSFNLYRSAKDEPAERNLLVISAHVVWGASLGALTKVAD